MNFSEENVIEHQLLSSSEPLAFADFSLIICTTTTTYSLISNHHLHDFDQVASGLVLSIEVSGAVILLNLAPIKVGKSNEHLDVPY